MKKEFQKKSVAKKEAPRKFRWKMILSVSVSVFIILISVFGIWFIATDGNIFRPQTHIIHYYPVNYAENIFDNQVYMSFERELLYSNSKEEQPFDYETDYESASEECKFFLDYFKTVIEGKYSEYPTFFMDDYFDEDPKFTMQMIYEPYVSYHSTGVETIDSKETEVYNFYVRYRIFRNNGTFRTGVESNTAVPQIYQLIKIDETTYRIYRILDINFES